MGVIELQRYMLAAGHSLTPTKTWVLAPACSRSRTNLKLRDNRIAFSFEKDACIMQSSEASWLSDSPVNAGMPQRSLHPCNNAEHVLPLQSGRPFPQKFACDIPLVCKRVLAVSLSVPPQERSASGRRTLLPTQQLSQRATDGSPEQNGQTNRQ